MNKVIWSRNLSGKGKLPISKTGTMNEVEHHPPPAAAAELAIAGNELDLEKACVGGQPVSVSGNQNDIVLTGDCGALTVTGNENDVHVDGVTSITVSGASNDVKWKRNLSGKRQPPVSATGTHNDVHQN